MNLNGLSTAIGLGEDDRELVRELAEVLKRNEPKHEKRRKYYNDQVKPAMRGCKVPEEFAGMNCSTGWCAKVVNMLAERSVLDSFTFEDGAPEGFEDVIEANDLPLMYQMSMPSVLTDGVGFWTVSRGDGGEPGVVISYHDATTASAVWDYRHKRVRAGMVIADFARFGRSKIYIPSLAFIYKPDEYIQLTRTDGKTWVAESIPHGMGIPPIVPMVYKQSTTRPFGRSRISHAVMGYTDAMMEELLNTAIQSEYFSIPQKYILGLADGQYDQLAQSMHEAYKAEMFLATTNDEGGNPVVGMLQGASMAPHISVMDKLASLMAAETGLPIATFGVASNGYTSSDALRASMDDLVVLAKSVNKANGKCLAQVAQMVLAILGDKPISELGGNERSVTAHFDDPAMPSDAANADAMIKVVSAVPDFAGTDVFWEKLGYGEDDRRRINSGIMRRQAVNAIASLNFQDVPSEAGNGE
ncbi:MAG: phage portal protein [Atopobiaceae bacterium]|nr:phage portal protein [Atopobiaceae bacterium]